MNNVKIPLGVLLAILAAVGFSFFCFLSFNFVSLGEVNSSLIKALIIFSVLIVLSFGVKILKQTRRKFKICRLFEYLFLFLLTITITFLTIIPFSHYFVISAQKKEIKEKVLPCIIKAESMFLEYEQYANERVDNWERELTSMLQRRKDGNISDRNYRDTWIFDINVNAEIQKEGKLEDLKLALSDYREIKGEPFWFADARKTIDSWKPINVAKVVKLLEHKVNLCFEKLVTLSEYEQDNEKVINFSVNFSFDDVVTSFDDELRLFKNWGKPTLISIALAFVTLMLMLLPYLITERNENNLTFTELFFSDEPSPSGRTFGSNIRK